MSRRGKKRHGTQKKPFTGRETPVSPPWGLGHFLLPSILLRDLGLSWAECSSAHPTRSLTLSFRKQRPRQPQSAASPWAPALERGTLPPTPPFRLSPGRPPSQQPRQFRRPLGADNSPCLALCPLFLSLFVGFIIFVTGGATRDGLCLQGDLAGGEMIRKATVLPSSLGM